MNTARSRKKHKKELRTTMEDGEMELNIKYHNVNPQWNYTISPRPKSKQVNKAKSKSYC